MEINIRKLIGAAVLTIAALATFNNTASAQAIQPADRTIIQILKPEPIPPPVVPEVIVKPKPVKPKVKKHTVRNGQTLISIGKKYKTDWKRIWSANKKLKHQDNLKVGQVLVIPENDAKLKARKLIEARQAIVSEAVRNVSGSVSNTPQTSSGASSGNLYTPNNCTWYAKSRRPDLPNNLGDSINWVANAAAQGFATGSTPRAGAVGQQGMHVVVIEKVEGNRVYLSEMNYDFNGGFRYRWASASDFAYIY